uniref:Uncharacterized protein n=1 Tax=Zea mays TaxID=4577 RepID=A0A804R6E6_MAIZE
MDDADARRSDGEADKGAAVGMTARLARIGKATVGEATAVDAAETEVGHSRTESKAEVTSSGGKPHQACAAHVDHTADKLGERGNQRKRNGVQFISSRSMIGEARQGCMEREAKRVRWLEHEIRAKALTICYLDDDEDLAPAAGVRGGRPGGGAALAFEEEEESFQLNPALTRHWPGLVVARH